MTYYQTEQTNPISTLLAVCILAAFMSLPGCARHVNTPDVSAQGSSVMKQKEEDHVLNIVRQIREFPEWTRLGEVDTLVRKDFLERTDAIAQEETAILRKAVEKFVSELRSEHNYSVGQMSKLFVLNRYIFNVPERSDRGKARFFGGWSGVPMSDRDVDLLWPLKISTTGELSLVGSFHGYFGESFQAVQEFDYFDRRFGRRTKKRHRT
jgi:hypothetical protein